MMIIDMLTEGPLRFRDLERKIEGVNTATLSSRLKSMQAAELIERAEISRADVNYSLTELGERAIPILEAVNGFAEYSKQLEQEI